MAMKLPSIMNSPTTAEHRPFPLITLYGQAGIGKTTLAAEFPRPYLINVEGGVPAGIDIPTSGGRPIRDYNRFISYLEALRYEDHDRKTVIIDSLDSLEKKVIHPYIVQLNDYDSIEQPFGRASTRSAEVMDKILEHLEDLRFNKHMYVIFTAAAVKESFDDLINGSYYRFNLNLQKQLATKIFHESDFLFFMKPDVYMVANKKDKKAKPAGSERRDICTSIKPRYVAKARARGVPEVLEYKIGQGFQDIKPYLIDFITGKAPLQEVEAPLQVSEGQTVAEARAEQAEEQKPADPPADPEEKDHAKEQADYIEQVQKDAAQGREEAGEGLPNTPDTSVAIDSDEDDQIPF